MAQAKLDFAKSRNLRLGVGRSRLQSKFHKGFVSESKDQFQFAKGSTSNIILSPTRPIIYNSNNYYWDGFYKPHKDRPKQCFYAIQESDEELYNLKLPNGTFPRKIIFGCKGMNYCCDLDCCSYYTAAAGVVGAIVVFIGSLLMCEKCMSKRKDTK
ncbi:unnamed protein product [Caenorhabditis angaria]|uniref:CX domain-containing protein n=1 Tax=Caenorhabditis angaria TaxID=860376 RepID=A0A9P1IYS9_9PELO|nr:unnamed protein product [Caenorhabditis angaria]